MTCLDARERKALVDVAAGRKPPDLVVTNAKLVNVYTGEVEEGMAVGVKGERIAFVTAEKVGSEGAALVVDAGGRYLLPGFIDGHAHLACLHHVHEFLRYAAAGGTTTVITETCDIAFTVGMRGVYWFLDAIREQPIRVLATTPAALPVNPKVQEGWTFDLADLRKLLTEPEVVGMGEVSCWPRLIDGDVGLLSMLGEAAGQGKAIEGHSAGCRGRKLQAYVAAGVTSCHEAVTVEEAVERLRLGLHVMLRQGTLRQDLEAMAPLAQAGVDPRRLAVVTDGVEPGELIEKGYMDHVVQKAIDVGFDPVTAIRMATLNVAERFGLDRDLGGIAPGKFADMLLSPSLRQIKAELVIAKGRVIAQDGRLLVPVRRHRYPPEAYQALSLPADVTREIFRVGSGPWRRTARVRAIRLETDMLTREEIVSLPVRDSEILPDPERDVIKACAISTMDGRSHATAFVKGFGLKEGALAISYTWDVPDAMVVGASEEDMAAALRRLAQIGGGLVAVRAGRVAAELPLPVAGMISDAPLEEVAGGLQQWKEAAKAMGYPRANAFLALQTLTTLSVPFLRLTHRGLTAVREQELVELVVDGK